MKGILADINIQGHVDLLVTIMQAAITIANVPRLRQSREYANWVVDKLLDFLMRMDTLRGTGRLFVP